MKRSELKTGVVYAWSPRSHARPSKCVFVDLTVARVSNSPQRASQTTIRKSIDHETYWGREPSVYGRAFLQRRGFLAIAADVDDTTLITRTADFSAELNDLSEQFEISNDSGVTVIAPREVLSTWVDHLAAEQATEQERARHADLRKQQATAANAAFDRIEAALDNSRPPGPVNRYDEIVVSAAWLVDILERLALVVAAEELDDQS